MARVLLLAVAHQEVYELLVVLKEWFLTILLADNAQFVWRERKLFRTVVPFALIANKTPIKLLNDWVNGYASGTLASGTVHKLRMQTKYAGIS